jgi:hypothetical protein
VAGDFVGNTKISVVPLNAKGQFDALIPHIANSLTIQLGVDARSCYSNRSKNWQVCPMISTRP